LRLSAARNALVAMLGASAALGSTAYAQCSPELDGQSGTAGARLAVACAGTENDQQGDGTNQFIDLTVNGPINTTRDPLTRLRSNNSVVVNANVPTTIGFDSFSSVGNNVVSVVSGLVGGVSFTSSDSIATNDVTIGTAGSVFTPPSILNAAVQFIGFGLTDNRVFVDGQIDGFVPDFSRNPGGVWLINRGSGDLGSNRVSVSAGGSVSGEGDAIRLRSDDFNNESVIEPAGDVFNNGIGIAGSVQSSAGDGIDISAGGAAEVLTNNVFVQGSITANAGAGVIFSGAVVRSNSVIVENGGTISGFFGVEFLGSSGDLSENLLRIDQGGRVSASTQIGAFTFSNAGAISNRFLVDGELDSLFVTAFGEVGRNRVAVGASGRIGTPRPGVTAAINLSGNAGVRDNVFDIVGQVVATDPGTNNPVGIELVNQGSGALSGNGVAIRAAGSVTSEGDAIRLRTQDFNNEGAITPAGELFSNVVGIEGAITSSAGDGVELSSGGALAVRQNALTISGAVTANTGAGARFAGTTVSGNTVTLLVGGRINAASGVVFSGPNPGAPGVNNNTIDNSGVITAPTAASFGSGTGNRFINRAGGVVNGDIRFQSAASELVLFAGSTLNGNAIGAGSTTTTLTGSGAGQIALQRFSGMGALSVTSGSWTATGSASGFQSASITGGALTVNGVFNTPFTVSGGGVLNGVGSIGSLSLGAGGVVAPGSSIGTLNVTGPLSFTTASVYDVEIGGCPGLCSDRIIATGPVTISGGNVAVSVFGGLPAPAGRLPIVTGSSVTGTFSSLTATPDFSSISLEYGPTDVFLNFRVDALTGLSHATAPLLGAYGFSLLTRSTLDRLAEEENGARNPASNGCAIFVFSDGSPSQRVEGAPAEEEGSVTKAWARGFGAAGSIDPSASVAGVNYHLGGFAVGVEKSGGGLSLGAGVGVMTTDMDQTGHDVDFETAQIMLYGGYEDGPFDIGLALVGGRHSVDSIRTVRLGTVSGDARAAYSGWTYGAALEAGYGFDLGAVQLRPYTGLDYVRTELEAFQETGLPFGDLAVAARSEEVLRVAAGFRASSSKLLFGALRPAMRLAYARELIEGSDFSASFASAPGSGFSLRGAEIGRDRLLVGAGVALRAGKRGALGVSYDGEFSKSDAAHALSARFNYAF
jgi:uncharacterized protein with beta-barrel porin domain